MKQWLPSSQSTMSAQELTDATKRWIQHQLLLQEARRLDLNEEPGHVAAMARLEEQLLISTLRDSVIKVPQPTEEELRTFYQKNANRWYTKSTEVRGWIWLGTDEQDISSRWRQTRTGAAPLGGKEFDWVSINQLGPLGEDLTRINTGMFTQPEKWGKQWAFVQLLDRRPVGSLKPLTEVKEIVKQSYLVEQRSQLLDSLLFALRSKWTKKEKYFLAEIKDTVSTKSPEPAQTPIGRIQESVVPIPPAGDNDRSIEDLFLDIEKSEKKK
ncbi:MAG: hypothetical protein OEM52_05360 [bacterium]|nr:hypothetical protein [bacterium]